MATGFTFRFRESGGMPTILDLLFKDTETITKGDLVTITGSRNSHLEVQRADADSAALARNLIFVAEHGATIGQQVRVAAIYAIRNANTAAATVGDPVYLSGTAGGWSLTPGAIPITVGIVVVVSATVGVIIMAPQSSLNGALSAINNVMDTIFRIRDNADSTKKIAFEAGSVATGQTRTVTMADRDVNLDYATQRAFVTIPFASVRTLSATPYELIAAPGATKFIEVLSIHWWLDYGTATYDAAAAGDILTAKYTNAAGAAVVDGVAGDAIGAAVADYHTNVLAVPEVIPVANAAIVASVAVGEWYAAAGDSPLKAEIMYRVRTFEPA